MTTAEPTSERTEPTTDGNGPPRVALVALGGHVTERVTKHAADLLNLGWEVDLVVIDERRRREAEVDPRVRIHELMVAEEQRPIRRLERAIVFRLPGGSVAKARDLVAMSRVTRPIDVPLAGLAAAHRYLASGFHRRLFMPLYRHARPWALGRRGSRKLRWTRTTRIDAIVAADFDSVPLACRLARQHPAAVATTALDTRVVFGERVRSSA